MTDSRVDEGNVEDNKTIDKILKRLLPLHTDLYFGDMNSDTRGEWIDKAKSALAKLLIEEVEKLGTLSEHNGITFCEGYLQALDDVKKKIKELFSPTLRGEDEPKRTD